MLVFVYDLYMRLGYMAAEEAPGVTRDTVSRAPIGGARDKRETAICSSRPSLGKQASRSFASLARTNETNTISWLD